MERDQLVNEVAELIQATLDAEPKDGKLEKTYGMYSLTRACFGSRFRGLCGYFVGPPSPLMTMPETECFATAQWLIDIVLQLIGIRLIDIFREQTYYREQIKSYCEIAKKEFCFAKRGKIRYYLDSQARVSKEIEVWRPRFKQLFSCAKALGFEVFESSENQYHLYVALRVDLPEIMSGLKLQGATKDSQSNPLPA